MARLLFKLIPAVAVAGAGAVYVWSTLNELLRGEGSWQGAVLALVVGLVDLAILWWITRTVSHMEEPRS